MSKLKLTSVAMAISSVGIGSIVMAQQNYYQCMPCPSNHFAKPGAIGKDSCIYITDMKISDFSNRYEAKAGQSCVDGKVKQGYAYKVVLRGGNGGNTNYGTGGVGGYLEYNFFAHADGTFSLCAGSKGGNGLNSESGAGGGAGSYLKLNFGTNQDYYFVAGGGGGAGGYDTVSTDESGGGGGGGIGAGGSGAAGSNDNSDRPGGAGGNVGPYKGGEQTHSRNGWAEFTPGRGGQGLINGKNGPDYKCGGSGGGNGATGACRKSFANNQTNTSVYLYGINGPLAITTNIFGGNGAWAARPNRGSSGTTSIASNVPASFSAAGEGYAYLYYVE